MKILIVRLSSIGDVVTTLPVVGLLKNHIPNCTITWAVEEPASELVEGYPGIQQVLVVKRKQWIESVRACNILDAGKAFFAFVQTLRREQYDLVIDFQGLLKSGILVFLARGRRKLGYGNAREGATLFYTEKASPPDFNEHAIKRHMRLLEALCIAPEAHMVFGPLFGKEDDVSAEKLLHAQHIDRKRPIVFFHPAALWETKRWGAAKAAELCDTVQTAFDCQILLVGSGADRNYLDTICSRAQGQIQNLAGQTTLRELACLFSKADLVLSMDSGPMHLACAAGAPVIALFGPTAPWRTGPFGENYTVIRKNLPCSPCFKRKTCPEKHHRCMGDIAVEDVFKICCNYLNVKRKT